MPDGFADVGRLGGGGLALGQGADDSQFCVILAQARGGQGMHPATPPASAAGHTTVEERFNEIGAIGPYHYYHAFIVVTDPSGHETYIRGGPSAGGPSSGGLGAVFSGGGGSSGQSSGNSSRGSGSGQSESSNSANSTSPGSGPGGDDATNGPFGSLTTEYGPFVPGTVDYRPGATRVLVADQPGDQSRADISKLEHAADTVRDEHLPYNPFTTNSNATAREVLKRAGFQPVTPPVSAPGWDTKL